MQSSIKDCQRPISNLMVYMYIYMYFFFYFRVLTLLRKMPELCLSSESEVSITKFVVPKGRVHSTTSCTRSCFVVRCGGFSYVRSSMSAALRDASDSVG